MAEARCKHCGELAGTHSADRNACPYYHGFSRTRVFEPRIEQETDEAEQGLPDWDGKRRVREFVAFGATAEQRKNMELREQLFELEQERDAAIAREAEAAQEYRAAVRRRDALKDEMDARVSELEAECSRHRLMLECSEKRGNELETKLSEALETEREARRQPRCTCIALWLRPNPMCPEHGGERKP